MELSWVIFPGCSCLEVNFLKWLPFGNGLCSSLSGEMFVERREIEKDGFSLEMSVPVKRNEGQPLLGSFLFLGLITLV